MKKIILFALLIAAVAAAGFYTTRKACVLCFLPKQGGHAYPKLDLAGSQQKEVVEAEKRFRRHADEVCMKVCALRLEIVRMMERPDADTEALNRKIEEAGQLQTSLEKDVAAHVLEMKKHLSPEQTEKYLEGIRRELHSSMRHLGMSGTEAGHEGH